MNLLSVLACRLCGEDPAAYIRDDHVQLCMRIHAGVQAYVYTTQRRRRAGACIATRAYRIMSMRLRDAYSEEENFHEAARARLHGGGVVTAGE